MEDVKAVLRLVHQSKLILFQILLSVLDRHPEFDVNIKNFKGEFALGLAVRHGHTYVVEVNFSGDLNTGLL